MRILTSASNATVAPERCPRLLPARYANSRELQQVDQQFARGSLEQRRR
jgi:hypothetical protein